MNQGILIIILQTILLNNIFQNSSSHDQVVEFNRPIKVKIFKNINFAI